MKKKKKNIFIYPEKITEVFDGADFHIKYCLSFIKSYLFGDVLEVGAGCGSFTRHYMNKKISSMTLTEREADVIRLYFGLGKIKDDQVKDYAGRKGIELKKAEKWLNPNIAD